MSYQRLSPSKLSPSENPEVRAVSSKDDRPEEKKNGWRGWLEKMIEFKNDHTFFHRFRRF